MRYSFTCPAQGCSYEVKVDAANDEEAVGKIIAQGKEHGKKAHPDLPPMTEEQMKQMVRSGMKKD